MILPCLLMVFVLEWGRVERWLLFVTCPSPLHALLCFGGSALEAREKPRTSRKSSKGSSKSLGSEGRRLSLTLGCSALWLLISFHQLSFFMTVNNNINWVCSPFLSLCACVPVSQVRGLTAGLQTTDHPASTHPLRPLVTSPRNNLYRQDVEPQSPSVSEEKR